jgi:hypothetical protein
MPWNRKDYPDNWEEIRERILRRSNNRCEKCGVMNHVLINKSDRSDPSPQQWDMYNSMLRAEYSKAQAIKRMEFTRIVLTIAHLNHDKENHDVKDEDLAAWCQKCHLGHDMPRHVENRKYGRNHRKNQHKLF